MVSKADIRTRHRRWFPYRKPGYAGRLLEAKRLGSVRLRRTRNYNTRVFECTCMRAAVIASFLANNLIDFIERRSALRMKSIRRILKSSMRPTLVRIIFISVTGAALCPAANIYIAQGMSGTNSGSDCADAHSVSWFNSPANWGSGGNQIGPGTTVHLCGVLSSNLSVQGSGTNGAPITILFEANAKLSQAAGGPFLTLSNRSYVVVDGGTNGIIENTNASTTAQHVSSKGIVALSCNSCEVKNLTIENIYVHSGSGTEIDQTQSNCIVYSGNNFAIHDNTMHDAGWCIYLNGSGINNRIYNNNIYNVDHGIIVTPGAQSANAGPLYIYNNHVHDYANWDNASNGYHHDGIHCYTVPSPYPQPAGPPIQGAHWNGLWIYNNLFDGNIGGNATGHIFLEPGVQTDGSATPCMDSTSQVHIFGNVLLSGTTDNGTIDIGRASNHPLTTPLDFYNNTVAGGSAASGRAVVFENVNTVNAVNNIVGGANQLWSGISFTNTDHNGYINCPVGTSYNCWPAGSGNMTNNFNTWKIACAGCDSHAVNSQGNWGGVSSSTGALQAGSPMIGAGANLVYAVSGWPAEQINALATDRNGNVRQSGNWDIGALSSGAAGSAASAPTGLSATVK